MKSSLVLSAFLGYSGSCNEHQGQTQWASEMSRGKCCLVVLLCLQTKPLLPMMTNPKYQKLYNVTPGCLWQPAVSLLWSIQSLLQSQSVPAAWCIFTSAIDYQTIFDDYSSSPILVSANQRAHDAKGDQWEDRKLSPWLGHPVPQWESWRREKNDDTLICQCTFRPLSSQPGLIGLWANSKLNFNF